MSQVDIFVAVFPRYRFLGGFAMYMVNELFPAFSGGA